MLMLWVMVLAGCHQESPPPAKKTPPPMPAEAAVVEPDPLTSTNPDIVAKALRGPDAQYRLHVVQHLAELMAQQTISDGTLQALINTFEMDQDSDVVAAAADALGRNCHPAALEVLLHHLRVDNPHVHPHVLEILSERGGIRVANYLEAFAEELRISQRVDADSLREQVLVARQMILQRGAISACAKVNQPLVHDESPATLSTPEITPEKSTSP